MRLFARPLVTFGNHARRGRSLLRRRRGREPATEGMFSAAYPTAQTREKHLHIRKTNAKSNSQSNSLAPTGAGMDNRTCPLSTRLLLDRGGAIRGRRDREPVRDAPCEVDGQITSPIDVVAISPAHYSVAECVRRVMPQHRLTLFGQSLRNRNPSSQSLDLVSGLVVKLPAMREVKSSPVSQSRDYVAFVCHFAYTHIFTQPLVSYAAHSAAFCFIVCN